MRNRRGSSSSSSSFLFFSLKELWRDPEKVGLLAGGLCVGLFVVFVVKSTMSAQEQKREILRGTPGKHNPKLQDSTNQNRPFGDEFNAIALDVLETLDCLALFNETLTRNSGNAMNEYGDDWPDQQEQEQRRRLEQQHADDGGFENEEKWGGEEVDGGFENEEKWGDEVDASELEGGGEGFDDMRKPNIYGDFGDDEYMGYMGGMGYMDLTAKHLFCIAASSSAPDEITNELKCDASNSKRQTLLQLWSSARSQMKDDVLLKTLDLATEHPNQSLLGKDYHFWTPTGDDGLTYMLNVLNSENDVDNGGLHGLSESLGPSKIFVDVGGCLGTTCLAIQNLYPGTKIVSIEPAPPNWLLQQLNLRCNLSHDEFKSIKVVLAGVGPNDDDEDNMMGKLLWRPKSTTSTRAWSSSTERGTNDIELLVKLRQLKSILAEAGVYGDQTINVLNIDCEGCEYNLIPALSEEEFDAIPTVMGEVHWGYIPPAKLPSHKRGETTHERLCSHENFAKRAKECCAFPDLKVKSSVPGEVLIRDEGQNGRFPPTETTVMDVIPEGFCDNFKEWAAENFLYDVKDDWGWFELTSQA